MAGTRHGSAVCEAVSGAVSAAKRAASGAASKAVSMAVSGVTAAADALPSRFKGAWAQRAAQRKDERRKAAEATAANPAHSVSSEEKLRVRTFQRAVRRSERFKGAPAMVLLSVMPVEQQSGAATADFWATPEMLQLEQDLRKLEAEYGKANGSRIFSKDLSVPSKMRKMRVRMRDGWQEGMRRQRPSGKGRKFGMGRSTTRKPCPARPRSAMTLACSRLTV